MTSMQRAAIGLTTVLMMFLAGCGAKSPEADKAPEAAVAVVPPDLSKGPVNATLSPDAGTVTYGVSERSIELSVADVFGTRAGKFDKAVIVAQGHQGDRYDVVLRLEAPSDPKQDGGRCRAGREVSMRHVAFDTGSTVVSSSNDLSSCLQRLRVVAERRRPDGGLDFDLMRTNADGSDSPLYLSYDTADFTKSINF